MAATWLEAIPLLENLFDTGWNRANTGQRKPVIADITTVDPGRGKRLDIQRQDAVLFYETAHNEEQPELLYDFVHTRINVTVDIRTTVSREQLYKMENEVRRIVHANRRGDAVNFDRMIYKTRTDLSDRTKKLWRYTFQVEIVTFAELIP